MDLIPNFPTEVGAENGVEFAKDGAVYRIARSGESTWIIHRRGASASDFELTLVGDGRTFDVHGRNGLVQINGMGASVNTIFTKMF